MKLLFVILCLAIPLLAIAVYQTTGGEQTGDILPLPHTPVHKPVRTLQQFKVQIRSGMSTGEVRKRMGPPDSITSRFEMGPPGGYAIRFDLFHKIVGWTYHIEGQEALLNFCDGKLDSFGY